MNTKQILTEAKRIEESAKYSAQGQFEQAKIWSKRSTFLGIPSSGLGAVAGIGGLADLFGNKVTGLLAIGAAFLTAIMTTLNYSKKIDQTHASANAYLALQQDARIFVEIDLNTINAQAGREALSELVARQQEINKTAIIPSPRAYKKAQENIKKGGQTYKVDGKKQR